MCVFIVFPCTFIVLRSYKVCWVLKKCHLAKALCTGRFVIIIKFLGYCNVSWALY